MRTWLRRVLWGLLLGVILAQAIPVSRTNPENNPARSLYANAAVPADVRSLLERSCADCHSNATTWPWYSRVAPVSWLVFREVQVGRRALNLDEWGAYSAERRDPIVVLNSHTHHDHVGGNWQFKDVLGMDTAFTRASAQGTTAGAQDELGPDMICGELPRGFDSRSCAARPWTITRWIHDGDRLDLGDRVLEILSTPGHTPDAVCLLDRQHGLLFTGDTYYPAPIWLFRPETNLDAYATSVQRLAPLTSHLMTVLGAHNVPIAPPQILPRLVSAFDDVRSGRVQPTREESKNTYSVGEISFVLRAAPPRAGRCVDYSYRHVVSFGERGDLDHARRGGGLLHVGTSSTVGGTRGRLMRDAVARRADSGRQRRHRLSKRAGNKPLRSLGCF